MLVAITSHTQVFIKLIMITFAVIHRCNKKRIKLLHNKYMHLWITFQFLDQRIKNMAPTLFRKTSSALSSFSTSWTVENANPEGVQKGVNYLRGRLGDNPQGQHAGGSSCPTYWKARSGIWEHIEGIQSPIVAPELGFSLHFPILSLIYSYTFQLFIFFCIFYLCSLFFSSFFIVFQYLIFLLFYCCFTQDDLE